MVGSEGGFGNHPVEGAHQGCARRDRVAGVAAGHGAIARQHEVVGRVAGERVAQFAQQSLQGADEPLAASDRATDVVGYLTRTGSRVLATLDEIAAAHGARAATIALAWLLSRPHVVAPVVSASSPEQVDDLVAAAAIRLTRHEVTQLDRASEPRR